MGPEINIESILALEKRIKEGTGDIIQLKRTRNSLLNISTRVPPEILGYIFRWNVIPVGDFDGLVKGSYNFVLVCHHWFEVASSTPELWSFWGNTLEQWSKRHQFSGTDPIDLVIGEYHSRRVDIAHDSLRNAIQNRVASNSIRSIRFRDPDSPTRRFLHSSLIPDGNDVRPSNIQSIVLHDFDLPELFTRHRFPRLRHLDLDISPGGTILPWDLLSSRLTTLTTLSLTIGNVPPCPSTSQLLAILASNPQLQQLYIHERVTVPHQDETPSLVPLRHLKTLRLAGKPQTFELLRRLDLPKKLGSVDFSLFDCQVEDVRRIFGAYLRDYPGRGGGPRDALCIHLESTERSITIGISTVTAAGVQASYPRETLPFVSFQAVTLPGFDAMDKLSVELITCLPTEHVRCLRVKADITAVQEVISVMPNIEELRLVSPTIEDRFLRPSPDSTSPNLKLLPSLRFLQLDRPIVDYGVWRLFISYLAHQTSGGQAISVGITGRPIFLCPRVAERIRDLVQELVLDPPLEKDCSVRFCQECGELEEQGWEGNADDYGEDTCAEDGSFDF